MDDEGLEAVIMAHLSAQLSHFANLADFNQSSGKSSNEDILRGEIEQTKKMIRLAYDNGVRILSGSESGFALTPYGHWHGRELESVNSLDLTPLEAITTVTKMELGQCKWKIN